MGHDACFVIGRAPAVEPAVTFDGGERFGLPQRQVSGRLDVVVGVQQDRWLSRGGGPARHDGRPAGSAVLFVAPQDPDILDSRGPHQVGHGLGAAVQRGGIEAWPGDTREPNKVLQVSNRGVEGLVYGPAQGIDVDLRRILR